MKIISILAVLSALSGLVATTINWALGALDKFEDSWEEGWFEPATEISWLVTEWSIGFAVLLLAIGMAIQSFKKKDPTQPTT